MTMTAEKTDRTQKGGHKSMWETLKGKWVETLCTAVIAFFTFLLKKTRDRIKKETEEQQILKMGMTALLHDCLFTRCGEYIARGSMSTNEFENLTVLYNSYHALGGNGAGTALYERCKELEIK